MNGKIINLFGGPCAGKSTWRAGLFFHMKRAGFNVEEVDEWIKGAIYEERHQTIPHQPYIFGKQLRNMERVIGKAEVVITDSPILLCAFYGRKFAPKFSPLLYAGMIEEFKRLGGTNLLLRRVGTYSPIGRLHTEAEADAAGDEIARMLSDNRIEFTEFRADEDDRIIKHCLDYVNGISTCKSST